MNKMSKSLGNYVGVSEPPGEMFGKLMSISDALMDRYYLLLLGQKTPQGHPMDAKKELARRIVERYHSTAAGDAWQPGGFQYARFQRGATLDKADLPKVSLAGATGDIVSAVVTAYAEGFKLTKSRGDARRLVEQGSVQLNGEKITEPKATCGIQGGRCAAARQDARGARGRDLAPERRI